MWIALLLAGPGDQVERLEAVEHVLERLGLRAARVAAPDVEGEAGGVDSSPARTVLVTVSGASVPDTLRTPWPMYTASAKASGRRPPAAAGRTP